MLNRIDNHIRSIMVKAYYATKRQVHRLRSRVKTVVLLLPQMIYIYIYILWGGGPTKPQRVTNEKQ